MSRCSCCVSYCINACDICEQFELQIAKQKKGIKFESSVQSGTPHILAVKNSRLKPPMKKVVTKRKRFPGYNEIRKSCKKKQA